MGGFFNSLFGAGQAQSQAAGQMYNQAANSYGQAGGAYNTALGTYGAAQGAYDSIGSQVNPFITQQMLQGFSPQTYGTAMNQTMDSGLSNIAQLRKQLGAASPNIAGQTGDALNSSVQGSATTAATLAGQNQQYQDTAANQLASNYNTIGAGTSGVASGQAGVGQGFSGIGSGFTNIGGQYQQAAQAAEAQGSPFSNLLNIASMFVPGGQLASIGSALGGLFSSGGGGGTSSGFGFGQGLQSYGPLQAAPSVQS